MTPYKPGDEPKFTRDFCCWHFANCYCCPSPRFDGAQALFKQARELHRAGEPWLHLRPENYARDKWEKT